MLMRFTPTGINLKLPMTLVIVTYHYLCDVNGIYEVVSEVKSPRFRLVAVGLTASPLFLEDSRSRTTLW
jgi:hypothetical protein